MVSLKIEEKLANLSCILLTILLLANGHLLQFITQIYPYLLPSKDPSTIYPFLFPCSCSLLHFRI